MLDKIPQENFEHILNVLILYKQLNPSIDVRLNEISIKNAFDFMNSSGKNIAKQLGMN